MTPITVLFRRFSLRSSVLKKSSALVGILPPHLSTVYVAVEKGYEIDTHKVTTEDGYILKLHKLRPRKLVRRKGTVILQHGLWSSSTDWIMPGCNNSLAYLLADSGFDVWLPNSRGNIYSRDHVDYSVSTRDNIYWNFSWHEMGYYDLPAVIDYVLPMTQQKELFYIGHSQGSTIFFVLCSTRPEYNNKIKAMVALAPVVYLHNTRNSVLKSLSPFSDSLLALTKMSGQYKLPEEWVLSAIGKATQNRPELCSKMACFVLDSLCGYACQEVRKNVLAIALLHIASGASFKQLAHFAQICKDGKFQQFNYGSSQNTLIYGSANPPEYDLKKITTPIHLYYSDHDELVHPHDVHALYKLLPNKTGLHHIDLMKFNHLDFLWANKSKELIFESIIKVFNSVIKM